MTQYGHAGRHHGIGTPDCPRELHHHHDEKCEPPGAVALTDRRQRAREAAHDAASTAAPMYELLAAVDAAVETATRVKITTEMLDAMNPAVGNREARLRAALAAAGFEIEN